MCLTCGCNDAHREMGNNMTYEDLQHIAVGNHKTVDETLRTIYATATGDRSKHPQEYAEPREPVPGQFKVGNDWDRHEWAAEEPNKEPADRWNAGQWAGEGQIPIDSPIGTGPSGGGHSAGEQHWEPPDDK